MDEIYTAIGELIENGRSGVVATIIRQAGPSPRGIGAKCLIRDDGSFVGSVGGGFLEAQTIHKAQEVFETGLPTALYFSLEGKDVAATDMLCGGRVELLLEPVTAGDRACAELFQRIKTDLGQGKGGLLITLTDPKRWEQGTTPKLFLRQDGEMVGSLPHGRQIMDTLLRDHGRMVRARSLSVAAMTDDAGSPVEVLMEPVAARTLLYVFGGGHVSRQIVPLAAKVGFHVVVIDDREEFADPGRFPEATQVRCIPFEGVMERIPINDVSFLVIVTRGHMGDKSVLAQALTTDAGYIGMIGSRQKRELIYQALCGEGFTQADLARVHSPIGIPIGAETPEEIAVSIVAELIQARAQRE